MAVVRARAGAGLSTEPDPLEAGTSAASAAAEGLDGAHADLALVFASGSHLAAPEVTLEAVSGALSPGALIGCGAGGVLGSGREIESGSATAVWAASLGEGAVARPFHAAADDGDQEAGITGLPDVDPGSAVIMLADPYSFPAEAALVSLAERAPGLPVLGGLASALTPEGAGALFLGEEVREQGAVGISLEGVEVLPCVSQGAAPVGRELTITAAEGNAILELAGRPALEMLEQVITELSARERSLISGGLLLGIVIDGGKPEYRQGDFLVRGVLGADPKAGSLIVGAAVQPGQVVRLHARNPSSADEDLREALRLRMAAVGDERPVGALVFSCNGRGRAMFGTSDHDAQVVERELGGAPSAGFFAAGEIGPVGGRNFLHGFTATVAVFAG